MDQVLYFKVQGTFTPKKIPYSLTVPVTYFFGPATPEGWGSRRPEMLSQSQGVPSWGAPGRSAVGIGESLAIVVSRSTWDACPCLSPGSVVLGRL